MKTNIYKILPLAFAALLTASCQESELDLEPVLSTTTNSIFQSKDKIEANLLGIYSDAKSFLAFKGVAYNDVRGDDVVSLSPNIYECYSVYEMAIGLSTSDNTDAWAALYKVINEANTFLANVEQAKVVAGSDYDRYVAEAKFLRALSYYHLNKFFAAPYSLQPDGLSVPLRLNAESSTANNSLAQSTTAEVYEQILSDLSNDNIASLPSGGNTYDGVTRASQAAAHVLRQRVQLELGNWQEAIAEGKAVTGYSLAASVASVFANSINSEVIFSFPMAPTNKGGNQTALSYYYATGRLFVIDTQYSYAANPAYSLPADARIAELTEPVEGNLKLMKFTDLANYLDWTPVFRLAEVKLNLAEAYAKAGQQDDAIKELEAVRRRSIAEADDVINLSSLSGSDLLNAIYLERRAELVGEGIRALDLTRRGESIVKRNGTFSPSTNGYVWPIPTSERVVNKLIK